MLKSNTTPPPSGPIGNLAQALGRPFDVAEQEPYQPEQRRPRIDIKEVARAALASSQRVVSHFLPSGRREGNEWVARNPTRDDKHLGSFKINLSNGKWNDFATGDKGGDLVSLVAYLEGTNQLEAARRLAKFLGMADPGQANPTPAQPAVAAPSPQPQSPPEPQYAPTLVPGIPPETLGSAPQSHPKLGSPSCVWTYHNRDGQPAFYIHRYDLKDAQGNLVLDETGKPKKEFRPLSWSSEKGWMWKAPSDPRPLYNLHLLAAGPSGPVLICEGEKAADAGADLFPQVICTTTLNGAQSPERTDLSPLEGRSVAIWPDHDEAGAQYAQKVARLALAAGAESVSILNPQALARDPHTGQPRALPAKWDAADALSDGWTETAIPIDAWEEVPRVPPVGGVQGPAPDASEIERLVAAAPDPNEAEKVRHALTYISRNARIADMNHDADHVIGYALSDAWGNTAPKLARALAGDWDARTGGKSLTVFEGADPDYYANRGNPVTNDSLFMLARACGWAHEEPWGDPKPLPELRQEVASWTEELLPEGFRPWLSDIAERMQCPPEFPAVGALVSISALVGRQIGIRPKRHDDWLVVPNLWGAIVGRPGIMKTPAAAARG